MPSYRVSLAVGALVAGVAPDRVLPGARAAAEDLAVVEAADVQVVSGQARIVIRFVAEDGDEALRIGMQVADRTALLVAVASWRVTERIGAQWHVVG